MSNIYIDNSTPFPPIVCFRCTRRCNLHCSFCFASKQSKELSFEDIKEILFALKKGGTNNIRLGGGEPTVRPDLSEIITYAKSIGLNIILSSNLFDISRVFKTIIQYQIPVLTSIHGDMSYHDCITGCPGSFSRVCDNIIKLRNSNIPVTVHFVLMPDNFSYVHFVIEKCIELGVKKITFQTCLPRENGHTVVNEGNFDKRTINAQLNYINSMASQYAQLIKIKTINMYEQFYYVLEPDRIIYLEKALVEDDDVCYFV